MDCKIRKIIKWGIVLCFIFIVVGCKSVKSNDEMEKIIKKENLTYTEEPYYKNQYVSLGDNNGNKWFMYEKKGLKYVDYNITDEDKLIEKIKNKDIKKSYQNFFDDFEVTQNDIESYLKNKYEKCTTEFNKLSKKDKILYTWDNDNSFSDEDKIEGKNFLNSLSNSKISKLYKALMNSDEERLDVSILTLKDYYYRYVEAPYDISYVIDNLEMGLTDDIGANTMLFDTVVNNNNKTTLYYSLSPADGSISGKYTFTYNKSGEVVNMALLISSYKTADVPLLYSGYLVWAAQDDLDSVYDGVVIATKSYDTEFIAGDFSHSLLLDTDAPGFIMTPF